MAKGIIKSTIIIFGLMLALMLIFGFIECFLLNNNCQVAYDIWNGFQNLLSDLIHILSILVKDFYEGKIISIQAGTAGSRNLSAGL